MGVSQDRTVVSVVIPGIAVISSSLGPETPDDCLHTIEDSLRTALRDCMEREAADATTDRVVARLAEILVALENTEGDER
jgi:hypothetical protein